MLLKKGSYVIFPHIYWYSNKLNLVQIIMWGNMPIKCDNANTVSMDVSVFSSFEPCKKSRYVVPNDTVLPNTFII